MNQDIGTFQWELTIHLGTENNQVHIFFMFYIIVINNKIKFIEKNLYIYIYIYIQYFVCVCVYIYIYIYTVLLEILWTL